MLARFTHRHAKIRMFANSVVMDRFNLQQRRAVLFFPRFVNYIQIFLKVCLFAVPENERNPRNILNCLPIAFSVTTRDEHFGVGIFPNRSPDDLTGFLVCGIGHGAGVDDANVRGIVRPHDSISVTKHHLLHRLCVVLVHLASQGDECRCWHIRSPSMDRVNIRKASAHSCRKSPGTYRLSPHASSLPPCRPH